MPPRLSRPRRTARAIVLALLGALLVAGLVGPRPARADVTISSSIPSKEYSRWSFGVRPFDSRDAYDSDGWGRSCPSSKYLGKATYSGGTITVRTKLVPLVNTLIQITEKKYGYRLYAGQTFGYNCRSVRGSSHLSNHGRGLAVDMNSLQNPFSYTFRTTIPPEVVMLWVHHGFNWGGFYSYPTRFDTMHFEYADSPTDVARYLASAQAVLAGTESVPKKISCPDLDRPTYSTLGKGASGADVVIAQCLLMRTGQGVRIDGEFGSNTASTVSRFRQSIGFSAYTKLTPRTWVALQAWGSAPVLKRGSTSVHVPRLQRSLRAAGFIDLKVTGIYDTATHAAVRAYQARTELTVDGVAGAATWKALQKGRLT